MFKNIELRCSVPLETRSGAPLEYQEKIAVTLMGDASKEACATRLAVARAATGMTKTEFCKAAGVSLTSFLNAEAARSYPSRTVMLYLHRNHRIDFNFILHGDFQQLPAEVQAVLLEMLEKTKEMKALNRLSAEQRTVELSQIEPFLRGQRPRSD